MCQGTGIIIRQQSWPHPGEPDSGHRAGSDFEPLEQVDVDADIVCRRQPNGIGVRHNHDQPFRMARAQRIERSHDPHLRFAQRFAVRETGAAGVMLDAGPQLVFVQFLEFGALPLAVVHLLQRLDQPDRKTSRRSDRLGSFDGAIQRAGIDRVDRQICQARRQIGCLTPPFFVQAHSGETTGKPTVYHIVCAVTNQ
jgi:hypothetical protein